MTGFGRSAIGSIGCSTSVTTCCELPGLLACHSNGALLPVDATMCRGP